VCTSLVILYKRLSAFSVDGRTERSDYYGNKCQPFVLVPAMLPAIDSGASRWFCCQPLSLVPAEVPVIDSGARYVARYLFVIIFHL